MVWRGTNAEHRRTFEQRRVPIGEPLLAGRRDGRVADARLGRLAEQPTREEAIELAGNRVADDEDGAIAELRKRVGHRGKGHARLVAITFSAHRAQTVTWPQGMKTCDGGAS